MLRRARGFTISKAAANHFARLSTVTPIEYGSLHSSVQLERSVFGGLSKSKTQSWRTNQTIRSHPTSSGCLSLTLCGATSPTECRSLPTGGPANTGTARVGWAMPTAGCCVRLDQPGMSTYFTRAADRGVARCHPNPIIGCTNFRESPLLRTSIQKSSIGTSSNFCEAKKEHAH